MQDEFFIVEIGSIVILCTTSTLYYLIICKYLTIFTTPSLIKYFTHIRGNYFSDFSPTSAALV